MKKSLHSDRPRLAALLLPWAAALALAGCLGESAKSLKEAGRAELDKKDPRAAVINLKNALQAEPNSVETRFLLGRALLESGEPAAAVVELNRSLDQKYDANKVMPLLARAMLLSGEHKRLTTLFNDIELTEKTAQAGLKSSLATAWGLIGDKAKTEAAVSAALAAVPDFPSARLLEVRLVAGSGGYDKALALTEDILARNPNSAETWHLKGELLAFAKKDETGAVDAFRKALALERAFVPGHVALINSYIRSGDLDSARKQADTLRELLPRHPQLVFADAELAYAAKDYKKAREGLQLLLRSTPNNTLLLIMSGAVEANSGSLLQAQAHFAKVLQLDPTLRLARTNLARVNLRLGQPARALETVQPLVGPEKDDAEALSLAGDAALQLSDARAAEAFYSRAAKSKPGDERIDTALALTQLTRGDDTRAFERLQALQGQSKDTYVDLALVSERMKRNQFDAALTAVDAMVQKQPNVAATHELRGRVLMGRRDMPAARAAFEKALTLDPQLFIATSNLATIDLLEKKPERAQQRMRDVIKADPRNHFAYMALAELRQREGAKLDEVRQLLADAIKAAPTDPGPRLQIIELMVRRRQLKDALVLAQEAAAAMPNDSDVLDALGRVQAQSGDTQQAISTFRRVTGIDGGSARPHVRLADVLRTSGNSGAAVASLRRALELEPDLEIARTRLIEVLVNDGRMKEALEISRDMQKRAPASSAGYLMEFGVHRRAKANDEALAALRAGVARAEDKSDLASQLVKQLQAMKMNAEADRFAAGWVKEYPEDAAVIYLLGISAISAGDLPKAEGYLQRAVKLRPLNALALNNLAWVLSMQGKPGAVGFAQRAVEQAPNQAAILDTLATALAADKDIPKALETSKKAVDIAPGDMGLRLNLARIALQAGEKKIARAELDRLATLGARFPFQAEVQKLQAQL
jgi:cellulose synthase operon protein C